MQTPSQPNKENDANIELPELQVEEVELLKLPPGTQIEDIQQVGDYTIALIQGNNFIQIYDKHGRRVEDFDNIGERFLEAPAPFVYKEKNKTYVCMDGGNDEDLDIQKKDFLAQPGMGKYSRILKKKLMKVFISFAELSCGSNLKKITLSPDGRYVCLFSSKLNFVLYDTQDAKGNQQPARNWKRYDNVDENVPDDILKFLNHLEADTGATNRIKINERLYARITDGKIEILEANNNPLYEDKITGVNNNVCVDPQNPDVVYYCRSKNAGEIIKLDTSGDPASWRGQAAAFDKPYAIINGLQLDPTGNFFIFNIAPTGIQILEKDTLKEVKKVDGVTQAMFDKDGRIRGVKNGNLVILEANFKVRTAAMKKKREAEALEGIDFKDIFADEDAPNESESGDANFERSEHIVELKGRCEMAYNEKIDAAKDEKDLEKIGAGLLKLEDRLRKKGIPGKDIAFIKSGVESRIKEKQAEIAKNEVGHAIERIRKKLEAGSSPGSIISMQDDLRRIENLEGHLDGENSEEIDEIRTAVETRTSEFYIQNSEKIKNGIVNLLKGTEEKLKAFTKKRDFDDWLEYTLPQMKVKLGKMANDCPIEAHESHASIVDVRHRLDELAEEYKLKFETEYKEVRSRAAEKISQSSNLIRSEIESFIDRLRDKKFKTRQAAEAYISASEARKCIEEEISLLKANDSEAAKELERSLKVGISNVHGEIERGAYELISENGQSMVKFGECEFPKWEARVKKKVTRNVDIVFLGDDRTKGPGIGPGEIMGDIGLSIRSANGETKVVRLYEGEDDEDDLRYGINSYRGKSIPNAYLNQESYKKFKKLYADWCKGEKSELKRNFKSKREAVLSWFDDVPKDKRIKPSDEDRKQKIEDYANFCEENMIFLLKRVEKIAGAKDPEHQNGKGAVPGWSNHWVIAPEDEKMLEEMSTMFKMQLKNQEGVLNLAGHAGTGKDVLIKIFANRTSRPYFAFDCSKWTTEFELSEDIVIEAEGGASKTVKVPSTVLNAMQTPGAIMYFNEFNAMPEQAQIFLHALFDEKRSLTLKTSSGKVIRSDPTMLLASSMNPDYPGTNKPQMATRSRMVTLPVNYPPIFREKDTGDSNPNKAYSASEALKIARNVGSFEDDTLEGNLNNNEFVKIWDKHINGIDNGARNLKPEEKFDLETILALVQFSNKLREEFIKNFEKTKGSEKALAVSQPITLREMRRCSYFLNEMSSAEKVKKSPDEVARDLIEKFFLTHIDKLEDKEKIKNAMKTWTSQKRLAA